MTLGSQTANRQTKYINTMNTAQYTNFCIQCGFSSSMPDPSAKAETKQLSKEGL